MTSLSHDDFNFRKQYRPPRTFNCIHLKYSCLFLFIHHTLCVYYSLHGRADIFRFWCVLISIIVIQMLIWISFNHIIYILKLKYILIQLTKPTIYYRFNSDTFLCLSQTRTYISNAIYFVVFFVCSMNWEMDFGWSFW